MSLCDTLRNRVNDIRTRRYIYPQGAEVKAWAEFFLCLMEKLGAGLDLEERLMAFLKEDWEAFRLPEEVKPWPLPCDMRSKEVRGQIFGDPQKAMVFSKGLAEAFRETGIELQDDETFACLVCVVPISGYMSEVIGPSFPDAVSTMSSLNFIPRPDILDMIIGVEERSKQS